MSNRRTLEQLADEGRARSKAQADEARRTAAAARLAEEAEQREMDARTFAIRHYSSRRSLTRWQAINWLNLDRGGLMLVASIVAAGLTIAGATTFGDGTLIGLLLLLPGIGALFGFAAWRVGAAIEHDRALRAGLPFGVVGYEVALAMGRSYPSDRVTIHFKGTMPASNLVSDLLALLPQPTKIEEVGPTTLMVEVNSTVGSKFDGHRRWFVRWFYALCQDVLVPLDREYPIERIVFRD